MKKIIKIAAILMCLIIFAGCTQNAGPDPESEEGVSDREPDSAPDVSEYEQITFQVCVGDPGSYIVYVITPDKITIYDFTKYWMNATGGYHYFTDDIPGEGEYTEEWIDLSPEGWERIVSAVIDNKFEKLPENMKVDDIYDGPSYFIEVRTENGTYLSGGYCAGLGDGRKQERYHNIVVTLSEVINDAREDAEEQWALFTEPQEPSYLYLPATAEYFEGLDDQTSYEELVNDLGPYDEFDDESLIWLYGWELEDGGIAWVGFGSMNRVEDIEIRYDDHCVILMSGLNTIPASSEEIYDLKDTGDLSEDEVKFFEAVSMMIFQENVAISEDHLNSLNDYEAVCSFGEETEFSEPEILGGLSGFARYRMSADDLAAFYSEVFGEERDYEPDFGPDSTDKDLPEIGIICLDDGYCYSYCGCGYEEYAEIISVAESSSACIVKANIISDMTGETVSSVRFVMYPTDGTFGYVLRGYVCRPL
ncbi:MAG: hypothetical protein J6X94_09625 [Lachnospiraceae bacterium]|nr:hypothetical protein [Lachnospiraceae bacterium]